MSIKSNVPEPVSHALLGAWHDDGANHVENIFPLATKLLSLSLANAEGEEICQRLCKICPRGQSLWFSRCFGYPFLKMERVFLLSQNLRSALYPGLRPKLHTSEGSCRMAFFKTDGRIVSELMELTRFEWFNWFLSCRWLGLASIQGWGTGIKQFQRPTARIHGNSPASLGHPQF